MSTAAHTFFREGKAVQFGEDDYAQVRAGEADLLGCFEAIDPGHAEIQQNKIGLVECRELHGILAVAGRSDDLKSARKLKVVTDETQRRRRIVSNQDTDLLLFAHQLTQAAPLTFVNDAGEHTEWKWERLPRENALGEPGCRRARGCKKV